MLFGTRSVAYLYLMFSTTALAYFGAPGTQVLVTKSQSSSPYGYAEYLPPDYTETSGAKYPIVLFLHGRGEIGDGESRLQEVLAHGPPEVIKSGTHLPAIVLSPQSPVWWNPATLDKFVDYLFRTYPAADPERLYVTGLSMGGGGAWDYASRYPERVAAIVPVCGSIAPSVDRARLRGKGIWAFHAFDDEIVKLQLSTGNIDAVRGSELSIMRDYPHESGNPQRAAPTDMTALYSGTSGKHSWITGASASSLEPELFLRFTVYRSGGHDSWTRAFRNPDLWKWLWTWRNGSHASGLP